MRRPRFFVDTWGWVGIAVWDDPAHERAVKWYRDLTDQGWLPVTSQLVVSEALTRVRYDVSHAAAVRLLDRIEAQVAADVLTVVALDADLWAAALTWFRRYTDQRFSVVDCTSFAIMHQWLINDALTADQHYAVAGFRPLGVAPPS